jgi:HD-GYP domain-containing protein (c-di-GMP phosphodiesterase class II)
VYNDKNSHYLKHVAELGDMIDILVREDIRDKAGKPLLAKGARIDGGSFEVLAGQELAQPLDYSIRVVDPINGPRLAGLFKRLMEESEILLPHILRRANHFDALAGIVYGVKLNAALANKLTVLEKRMPKLMRHSLEVATNALSLAALLELGEDDIQKLLLIGLLHDMGDLHLAPEIFAPDHALSHEEWRQIHAHPIIAFLLLKPFPEYHPAISQPILEHHERMDGSGYPRGVKGEAIGKLGKIAAVSETVTSILTKDSTDHLEVVLRLLNKKLDPTVVGALSKDLSRLPKNALKTDEEPPADLFFPEMVLIQLLENWDVLSNALNAVKPDLFPSLFARMKEIKKWAYQAGVFTEGDMRDLLMSDPETRYEMHSMIREILYQLNYALREAENLDQQADGAIPPEVAESLRQWLDYVASVNEKLQG